jgi:hypothetical protein
MLAAVPVAFLPRRWSARCWSARDPLALRPPAGDAAGHLGHQPDPDAGGAHDLRRAERRVENPSWMSGGMQVLPNLTLPYNRLASSALRAGAGWAWAADRKHAAGPVRARRHAEPPDGRCVGVNTARVDTYAFALGAGIAGLAGCALSQIGNVGPGPGPGLHRRLVHGGGAGRRGQLAGTVYAALGLGVLNKFLEGWTGAVLAKIVVLVFIIIFIQKRPQGCSPSRAGASNPEQRESAHENPCPFARAQLRRAQLAGGAVRRLRAGCRAGAATCWCRPAALFHLSTMPSRWSARSCATPSSRWRWT